jgi:ribosomal protein S18 acetylase RimI-like enzyme
MYTVFRRANITDCVPLSECNKECLPIFYRPAEYIYYILSPFHEIFMILDNSNSLVGYVLGQIDGSNFHIMSIGVYNKYRKMGFGSKLISCIIKNVDGCKSLTLYVHVENEVAVNFYKKNGFEIKEKLTNYYGDVLGYGVIPDAYLMKREVS